VTCSLQISDIPLPTAQYDSAMTSIPADLPPRVALADPAALARKSRGDVIFRGVLTLAALAIPVLLGFLVWELWTGSALARERFGADFVTSSAWDPVAEQFGALPLIFGTVVSSLLALLIAVPLSLGVAIYLTEFAPRAVRQPVATMIGLLAAIPSVVYGLWGIFVLIPFLRGSVFPALKGAFGFLPLFQGPIYGPSMLSAAIILAIMVMPYVMSVAREVLEAVPPGQREAALGMGATRWEAVRTAILPYARSGIFGAIVLGLGRALGETMAVTMLIGNRHEIAASLFAPGYTMAAAIANEFAEASGDLHLSALTYVAFVLFLVTVLVNAVARLLIWRVARGSGAGSRAT
jgi:phosphate transport system permease protein